MGTSDWDWLQAEVRTAAKAFADQLTAIDDTGVRVPNLEWSVADLTAHLIALPAFYREQTELDKPFEPPSDWPAFSLSVRAGITETNQHELARMLLAETDILLQDAGDDPHAPRTLYNQETTAANVAAGFLGELLLHGMDLAALTGAAVQLNTRQANAIIAQQMALAPSFVDRERARKCPGTYHLRFRGGDEFTYKMEDGLLCVEPGRPDRADCHMIADPVAFVLVSLGRMSQVKAGLTGKIIGYGRKPWLLLPLGKVRVDGV